MSLLLGCIADDYTGASDLANTLNKAGLRTIQTIGVPANDFKLPDIDAVVVSLKSRSIEATDAISKSLAAHRWLRMNNAGHVLFKICSTFDSTDKGNIGPVMDALMAETGDRIVLVTPAFPETGRTVYQGNLFVGAVPLNESPLKDHPLNPMHDANLVRVLARQSKSETGLVDFATVAKGTDAIRARVKTLVDKRVGAAIVDVVQDEQLESIARVALESRVSVGASGLGLGLAQALVAGTPRRSNQVETQRPIGGPVACLAGSCSQATLGQIAAAEKTMPVLRLDAGKILNDESEIENVMTWAASHLAQSPFLIASSSPPAELAALQARYGREASGHKIEQIMASIAQRLVAAGVRRLIVAGGETSGAVVDRLDLPGFTIGEEIAPGVPVLRVVGWSGGDMIVALKSGNFGGENFFHDAITKMP